MKKIINVLILNCILVIFCLPNGLGQEYFEPKNLNAKGIYFHKATKIEFPEKFENFSRTEITAFDRKKKNIGGTYEEQNDLGKTRISIFIYPAGNGEEGRLRYIFLSAEKDMLGTVGNVETRKSYPSKFKMDGFIINGYSSVMKSNQLSQLTVFECGQWFFKIRITSNLLDTNELKNLENKILETWKPTRLVSQAPLQTRPSILVAQAAAVDELMLGSMAGCALTKLGWARKNVDSLERLSGFPDLYLEMHLEGLKELVGFEKRKSIQEVKKETREYLDQLNQIIDNGFIEEFIMDQYNHIMIVPKNMSFDFIGYEKWKSDHPITASLDGYYLLSYPAK